MKARMMDSRAVMFQKLRQSHSGLKMLPRVMKPPSCWVPPGRKRNLREET